MEVNGVPNKYLKLEVEIPEVQRVPINIELTMTFSFIVIHSNQHKFRQFFCLKWSNFKNQCRHYFHAKFRILTINKPSMLSAKNSDSISSAFLTIIGYRDVQVVNRST